MKSLKEVYSFSNKKILNEEIDYGTKKAVVYHLCGNKVGVPDPLDAAEKAHGRARTQGDERATDNFNMSIEKNEPWILKRKENTSHSLGGWNRLMKPENKGERAQAVLRNLKRGGFKKYYTDINSLQGKAYALANSVKTDPYSTGSNFMAGEGKMYGKGLYTCYEFNPKIARTYGDVILRFEVDLTNYMIFTEDIAKKIHGENYRLEDQLKAILNRRGYDFERLSSDDGFDKFINFLKTKTEEYPFKGSTIDTRTAPLCLEALQYCSFHTEEKILLRKLVEGVLFQGSGDGPVCIIYYPEIATNYIMTGAGYFHPDTKDPVIHDDIEELADRKSSIQLKDYIEIEKEELSGSDRQEIVQDQIDQNKKDINVYLSRETEVKEENFMEEIAGYLKDLLTLESNLRAISQKVIEKRSQFSNDKVLDSAAKAIASIIFEVKMLPSEIIAPVIPAIEVISGKKINILSSEEFVGYLKNLKNIKISRKRKFNSFKELSDAYSYPDSRKINIDPDSKIDPLFPLLADENIDQASLDSVWDATLYIKTFKVFSPSNRASMKIRTLLQGLDSGYFGPEFLQMLNVRTEAPLIGGGFQFFEEGKESSQSVGITHEHLNVIEEELPAIKSLISSIHDLLKRSQTTLAEFNEVCSDCDLYKKESFEFYDSYKILPESFGLASFANTFSWPSCNIDVSMTFLYAFVESGKAKKYTSIFEAGNKVLVNNINPKEILLILGLDKIVDPYMLDYIDEEGGYSDSLYEFNMTNKNSVIDSMTESIKPVLINEIIENIVACSEMGTDEFLSSFEGGKQLGDMKI